MQHIDAHLIKSQKLVAPVKDSSIGNALHSKVEGVEELAPRGVAYTEGPSVQHLASGLLLHHGLCSHILVLEVHLAILECELANLHTPHRCEKEKQSDEEEKKKTKIAPVGGESGVCEFVCSCMTALTCMCVRVHSPSLRMSKEGRLS